MAPWLLLGCSGDDDGNRPPDPTDPSHSATTPAATGFVDGPRWSENTLGARLLGFVDATTEEPVALEITVDDGVSLRTFRSEAATTHQVLVTGLRPDTTHILHVTGPDLDAVALEVTTGPLPADLVLPTVTVLDPTRLEPGLTFLVMGEWMVMLDAQGVPAWLRRVISPDLHQVDVTPRGTLLMQADRDAVVELALTGEVVRWWRAARSTDEPADAIPVDALALHHDVVELPDGNLLSLSIERRTLPEYPTSESVLRPTAPADVIGDVIVEFRPDGTLVHEWSLLDRLEPRRIGWDSVNGDFWEGFFGGDPVKDWSHANSLWYDPLRDEVVVSLRHQDAVVALDHATGELTWIVAPDAWWPPALEALRFQPADGSFLEPYHQHAASIGPDGNLLLFDNGNRRASALEPPVPDDENLSRGLELQLDHASRTWSPAWSWGEQLAPPRFSGSLGDVDVLPQTGNRLTVFGNVKDPTLPGVSIYETTSGPTPELLWSLDFPQGDGLGTFRAERITGLVPGR